MGRNEAGPWLTYHRSTIAAHPSHGRRCPHGCGTVYHLTNPLAGLSPMDLHFGNLPVPSDTKSMNRQSKKDIQDRVTNRNIPTDPEPRHLFRTSPQKTL